MHWIRRSCWGVDDRWMTPSQSMRGRGSGGATPRGRAGTGKPPPSGGSGAAKKSSTLNPGNSRPGAVTTSASGAPPKVVKPGQVRPASRPPAAPRGCLSRPPVVSSALPRLGLKEKCATVAPLIPRRVTSTRYCTAHLRFGPAVPLTCCVALSVVTLAPSRSSHRERFVARVSHGMTTPHAM